jgi:hypothetical protein
MSTFPRDALPFPFISHLLCPCIYLYSIFNHGVWIPGSCFCFVLGRREQSQLALFRPTGLVMERVIQFWVQEKRAVQLGLGKEGQEGRCVFSLHSSIDGIKPGIHQ